MKHKMWSRLLSMALAVMMIASIVPNSAFAEAGSELAASSQVVTEMVEETEEVAQPEETTGEEPAEQPAGEPDPTAEPVAEPTAEPVTESEQPTAEPTQAPAETAVPSEQPSAEPSAAPEGTQTPEGTEAPEGTAVPSETPAASATPAPSESPVPSETPAATEEPEQGMSALTGEELVAALMQLDDEALVAALDTLTEEQIASVDALEAAKTEALFARLEVLFGAPETDVQEPLDFNAMSVEELYDYLSSLTDDDEYFQVLENLSDDIFSELIDYINSVTAGESVEVTEESDNGIVDFLNAAPLMSSGIQAPMFMRANYVTGFDKTDTAVAEGLKIKKSLENYHASTGEGTLLLEAYVTGKVTTETKSKPVDVILVLDQSGSMANRFGNKVSVYTKQNWNNGQAYNNRNNEIYVRGEDENYYKVTVDRAGGTISYEKASGDIRANQLGDNKYYYLATDGNYYSITTERGFGKTSIYANGNEIYSWEWFSGDGDTKIENIEALKDKVFKREVKYSYTYSSEGIENGVVSSEGANTETPVSLYLRQEKTLTALESLTNAVQNFTDSVAEKNAENRIAIVGFGSDSGDGDNTEVLTLPGTNSGSVGKKYSNRLSADDYKNAMVSASDPIVDKAINALASKGATRTDLGMEMARKILEQNGPTDGRKQIVIMFTDGVPTSYQNFDDTIAGNTIDEAWSIKNGYNATVYTVGIFANADGSNPQNANNLTKGSNKFMHAVSSNYLNAQGNTDRQSWNKRLGDPNPDLKGNDEAYFLSASNSDALNQVFENISEEVGGSSNENLTSTTVLYDKMSEYFDIPADGVENIKVYEVPATAINGENVIWGTPNEITSQVELEPNVATGTVKVSGFDYSEKFVGTKDGVVVGKKLVVEIPVQYDNTASFGGNNIPTNAGTSGIYNAQGDTCYGNFESPLVNMPINYQINAQNQTIYLTQSADLTKLMTYTTGYQPDGVKNRFVTITYTLMQKDTEIATLHIPAGISVTDANAPKWVAADGQTLSPSDLTDCKPYTISCTVSPSETAEDGSIGVPAQTPDQPYQAASTVHVLKPVITWKDTTKQYQAVVDPSTENLVTVDWKDSTAESVQGTTADVAFGVQVPKLSYEFSLVDGKEWPKENKITEEMQVKVTVKIGNGDVTQYTTFKWQKDAECPESCTDPNENNPEFQFRIHLGSGKLIITKKLTKLANNGSPVFDFKVTAEDGTVYYYHVDMTDKTLGDTKQVVEVTLPAGKYTVEELDNQNYDLAAVTGAISQNNGQVTIGGEPKTVNFTNEGKDTNIPTDNSGVVNELVKDENGKYTMSFQKKEELGQTTGSITSN